MASGRVIDVTTWGASEDFPIHPLGSKPKRVVICPDDCDDPDLIPSHSYLFKIADGRRALQLWSEVIAFRIGASIGLDVPPCFAGINRATGEAGALIEFFYGFPGQEQSARLVHAADVLQRLQATPRTDRPHNVRNNLLICNGLKLDDVVGWWARVLAFDALIGNTDRHPENWGWLVERMGQQVNWSFAPIFDNGTSLGWELLDERLGAENQPARIARYIDRGRHHCGWDRSSDSPTQHIELCRRLCEAYPAARDAMRPVASIEIARATGILNECAQSDVSVSFAPERVEFVAALIEARKRRLAAVIGA